MITVVGRTLLRFDIFNFERLGFGARVLWFFLKMYLESDYWIQRTSDYE